MRILGHLEGSCKNSAWNTFSVATGEEVLAASTFSNGYAPVAEDGANSLSSDTKLADPATVEPEVYEYFQSQASFDHAGEATVDQVGAALKNGLQNGDGGVARGEIDDSWQALGSLDKMAKASGSESAISGPLHVWSTDPGTDADTAYDATYSYGPDR